MDSLSLKEELSVPPVAVHCVRMNISKNLSFTLLHQKIKDKFPLPSPYQQLYKDTKDYKLIKKGKSDKGDWIELYQKDSHYLFVYESPTPDHTIHIKYANLDLLFKYIEDVISFKCQWE